MKTVKVIYKKTEDDAWIGTSLGAPGFVGYGSTLAEARAQVQEGLPFYLDEDNVLIFHVAPEDESDNVSEGPRVTLGVTQPTPAATYSAQRSTART